MPENREFVFHGASERLDRYIARELKPFSRNRLQKLVRAGRVTVNGKPAEVSHILSDEDRVVVTIPDFSGLPAASAESVPILFEDAELIVVDKPAGLVVHPAGPHQEDTLTQRLWPKLARGWASIVQGGGSNAPRPGVVHRLDKGTSGVIAIAKTPQTAENLSRQFANREVKKTYWALVCGIPKTLQGRVRSTVGRSRRQPHRMSVADPGREAELEFTVLESFTKGEEHALLEVRPMTGRTHQIRVQLSALGYPIAGDKTYGAAEEPLISRPLLHAMSLEIRHPVSKKRMTFRADLPRDFRSALKKLGWKAKR